jgi:hypothetical protein
MDLFDNGLLDLVVSSIVIVIWASVLVWKLHTIQTEGTIQRIVIYILWTMSCFAVMIGPSGLFAVITLPLIWTYFLKI